MIVCFLGYLLAVSVFFTTFVHKIYVVLKMEKVYAHREFGLEANIIGCATYELKAVEFIPEFVSKLNFYISAVDEYVKSPEDKPTIGLLLCRTKSNTKARFALRGITQPLGIAQYETEKLFADVASALPQIEDLEEALEEENEETEE